jgi:hypothetical protein
VDLLLFLLLTLVVAWPMLVLLSQGLRSEKGSEAQESFD